MTTIWHNPRCSKSRETLKLLQDRGIEPVQRLYLTDAPDADEIAAVIAALGRPARDLVRTGDAAFRETGLGKDAPDSALIAAMAANPALIERPVVITDKGAALGRPPEAVLALFD